ncbi:ubiquitin-conjugating enzyme/RWD-like protein [Chaetomium tenue]|uniref:Ubiquitin-conjugating enzyme/RWD-like protein n=1 Tax=Chaetomium tenue TaxID=1854479 RepID=A0ACB7PEB8_9PEZI|nr:ubiquitin-conjugating enzyme/RWD-like protein [Chaetomium globosum]
MADQSVFRITKELSELQKNSDLSLAVACRDIDVRNVKALIIGPHETPYEFGISKEVAAGHRDHDEWGPVQVQSQHLCQWQSMPSLMSSNPYENEPGFEDANETSDKKNQKDYVQKIRHETLRVSVIQRLEEYLKIGLDGAVTAPAATKDDYDLDMDTIEDESSTPFEPFKDLCKRRFLWYYDSYLATIKKGMAEVKDGTMFVRMPFEGSNNTMEGKFNYGELERRLQGIKKALDAETEAWAVEGLAAKSKDTTVAVNLQRQFEQIVEFFKRSGTAHNLELVDGNPFDWVLTYFGKPMTNLDGGLFRARLFFSPRFPEEQPRIKFETRLFHHRIAADGTPCYVVPSSRREDVKTHIEAIIEALEEDHPPYDPRTLVHPEAFKLYWGSPEDRRVYNRRLRRSVQQSMEYVY